MPLPLALAWYIAAAWFCPAEQQAVPGQCVPGLHQPAVRYPAAAVPLAEASQAEQGNYQTAC